MIENIEVKAQVMSKSTSSRKKKHVYIIEINASSFVQQQIKKLAIFMQNLVSFCHHKQAVLDVRYNKITLVYFRFLIRIETKTGLYKHE